MVWFKQAYGAFAVGTGAWGWGTNGTQAGASANALNYCNTQAPSVLLGMLEAVLGDGVIEGLCDQAPAAALVTPRAAAAAESLPFISASSSPSPRCLN